MGLTPSSSLAPAGTVTVAGTVTADQGVGGLSAWLVDIHGVPHVIVDAATIAALTNGSLVVGTLPALPAGGNVIGHVLVDSVSGTVLVDASGHTVPVTGPLTDTQLRASAVPVDASGATVPVSGPLTNTQLRAAAVPVSLSSLPNPSNLDVALSTRTKPADQQHAIIDSGTVTTITNVVHVDDNAGSLTVDGTVTSNQGTANATPWNENVAQVGGVAVVAGVKGTQQTNMIPVQDAKDAGRQSVTVAWEEMAGTAAAESALTNYTSAQRNASALGAANNYQVSSGKTLRIQLVQIYLKETSTVTNLGRFRIRQAASVANNSPIIFDAVLPGSSVGAVTAGSGQHEAIPIPGGLEVAAGQQITFTWFTSANTCTVGLVVHGFEY